VSRARPQPGCAEIRLDAECLLDEPAEVALEDYARALARAAGAEAVRSAGDPAWIAGVHLCGLASPLSDATASDVRAFARGLAAGPGGGLGWS